MGNKVKKYFAELLAKSAKMASKPRMLLPKDKITDIRDAGEGWTVEVDHGKPKQKIKSKNLKNIKGSKLTQSEKEMKKNEYFSNLAKAVKSPNKHLSRQFLTNTLQDHNISHAQGGKKQTEYQQEEMQDMLNDKNARHAENWADDQWDKWIDSQVQNIKGRMTKGEKGVHDSYLEPGRSEAGIKASIAKERPVTHWLEGKQAKELHQKKLKELKSMPKPNLPKNELVKSKNVREQRKKVFGSNPTPAVDSPARQKMMDHIVRYAQQRYNMPVERAPGKLNAMGEMIDKPELSNRSIQHIGNPASLLHELAHIEIMKDKGMDPNSFQKWMDKKWGQINVDYGYKQQAREAEEYESHGAETKMRRQLGLPIHRRETKEMGDKRLMAVDRPDKQIAMDIPHKGKTKRITGLSSNLDARKPQFEQRQAGEQVFSPDSGWSDSAEPDALINRKARGDWEGYRNLLRQKHAKAAPEHKAKIERLDKLIARLEAKKKRLAA
jgi:hypothetical protein